MSWWRDVLPKPKPKAGTESGSGAWRWTCAFPECETEINYTNGYAGMRRCPVCNTEKGQNQPPLTDHQRAYRKLFYAAQLQELVVNSDITGLLKELVAIVIAYANGFSQPNGKLFSSAPYEIRFVNETYWNFCTIDKLEPMRTLTAPPPQFRYTKGAYKPAYVPVPGRPPPPSVVGENGYWPEYTRHPKLKPKKKVVPSAESPYVVSRVRVSAVRHFDEGRMKAIYYSGPDLYIDRYASEITCDETSVEMESAVPVTDESGAAVSRAGVGTTKPNTTAYVWIPVTEDLFDGICQIELSERGRIVKPKPGVCFAGGQIMTANGEWMDVWNLKIGDAVRAPVLSDSALAGGAGANAVTYTVQRIAEIDRDSAEVASDGSTGPGAGAGDDFRIVSFGGLQLTCGHPIFARAKPSDPPEWYRADELQCAERQIVARGVINFRLDGGSYTVLCRTGSATADFVIVSTLGADCGERLARAFPAQHQLFGPASRPDSTVALNPKS